MYPSAIAEPLHAPVVIVPTVTKFANVVILGCDAVCITPVRLTPEKLLAVTVPPEAANVIVVLPLPSFTSKFEFTRLTPDPAVISNVLLENVNISVSDSSPIVVPIIRILPTVVDAKPVATSKSLSFLCQVVIILLTYHIEQL